MKKKKKYLPLYYKWMEAGQLPEFGLCCSLERYDGYDQLLLLFAPEDRWEACGFWAATPGNWEDELQQFTPLRQTIVLLMAALNGEKL